MNRTVRNAGRILAGLMVLAGTLLAGARQAGAADSVIDCHLRLDYPHSSTHFPGTVNVEASETCTAPVDYVVLSVTLIRDGIYLQPDGSCTAGGKASVTCNTAEACHSGSFYSAEADVEVDFPPGYQRSPNSEYWTVGPQQIFCPELDQNVSLLPGEALHSPDGNYSLVMQSSDGNLVEYGPNGAVWASCTTLWPGSVATMQDDGNFVVYGPGHIARFATGTRGPVRSCSCRMTEILLSMLRVTWRCGHQPSTASADRALAQAKR